MPGGSYPPRHVCRAQAFFTYLIELLIARLIATTNLTSDGTCNVLVVARFAGFGLRCSARGSPSALSSAPRPTPPPPPSPPRPGAADNAAEGPFQHRLSKAARGRYVACSTKCTTPPELRESIPKRRTAHIKIFYLKLLSKSLTSFT